MDSVPDCNCFRKVKSSLSTTKHTAIFSLFLGIAVDLFFPSCKNRRNDSSFSSIKNVIALIKIIMEDNPLCQY